MCIVMYMLIVAYLTLYCIYILLYYCVYSYSIVYYTSTYNA